MTALVPWISVNPQMDTPTAGFLFQKVKEFRGASPVIPECFYRESRHGQRSGRPLRTYGRDKWLGGESPLSFPNALVGNPDMGNDLDARLKRAGMTNGRG